MQNANSVSVESQTPAAPPHFDLSFMIREARLTIAVIELKPRFVIAAPSDQAQRGWGLFTHGPNLSQLAATRIPSRP